MLAALIQYSSNLLRQHMCPLLPSAQYTKLPRSQIHLGSPFAGHEHLFCSIQQLATMYPWCQPACNCVGPERTIAYPEFLQQGPVLQDDEKKHCMQTLTCMPPHKGYQCAPFVIPPGNSWLLDMSACASAYTLARWMKALSSGLSE